MARRRKRHPNFRWTSSLWPDSPGKRQKKAAIVSLTVGHDSRAGFRACALAGKMIDGPFRPDIRKHQACWTGKNPRVAMAGALRQMARLIARRKGAFAHYR